MGPVRTFSAKATTAVRLICMRSQSMTIATVNNPALTVAKAKNPALTIATIENPKMNCP